MPTEKRLRQREARYAKQAELQRARQRRRNLRRAGSLLALVVAVVLIVVLVSSGGGKKPKPTAAKSSTTTSTTNPYAAPTTQPLTSAAVVPTCPSDHEVTRVVWFAKAPPDCIGKTAVFDATFVTSLGDFTVQMDAASSYAAVNNFVFLARWNYYNGTFFHRIIPGFVIQGGDPAGTGTGGVHGYPGYHFTGNYPPASCKTEPSGAGCYVPGDLVMANSNSDPETQNASTDGSQFFVVLPGGQKTLNKEPTYTIFGKVISGMPIVEQIGKDGVSTPGADQGKPTVKIYLLSVTVKQLKP